MAENDHPSAVVGIGIDLVKIDEINDLDQRTGGSFVKQTFTEGEKTEAGKRPDPYEYLAGRYAVKEAVFKAIVSRCSAPFDFRIVETADDGTGKPFLVMNPGFRKICSEADVSRIFISISHDAGFAIAIAEAVGK